MNQKIVWRTLQILCILLINLISTNYGYSDNISNFEEYISDSNDYDSNSTSKETIINDFHNREEANKMPSEYNDTLQAFTTTNVSDNQIIVDVSQPKEINSYLRRDMKSTAATVEIATAAPSIDIATTVTPSTPLLSDRIRTTTTTTTTAGDIENYALTTTPIPEYVQSKSEEENVSNEMKEFQLLQPQMATLRDKQYDGIIVANNATNIWMNNYDDDDYESKHHKTRHHEYDGIAEEIAPIAMKLFATRDMKARNGRNHNGERDYKNENVNVNVNDEDDVDVNDDNSAETTAIIELEEEVKEPQEQQHSKIDKFNNLKQPFAMPQKHILHDITNTRLRSQIMSQNDSYDYSVYDNYGSDEVEYSSHNSKHSIATDSRQRTYNNIVAESISQEQLMPPSLLPSVAQAHQQQQQHHQQQQQQPSDHILMKSLWTTPSFLPTTSTYKYNTNSNSNSDELFDGIYSSSASASTSSFTPSALAMTTSMVQSQKAAQPFQSWTTSGSDKRGKHIAISNLDMAATTIKSTTMATVAATIAATSTTTPTTTTTTTTSTSSTTPVTLPSTTTTTTTNSNSNNNNNSLGRSNNKRRLLPHEQLRNYIEDAYIRMPVAVIVDPAAHSLEQTKILWNEALPNSIDIKIILVALNGSGIPAAFSFNNGRQFLMGLNSIKERNGNGNAFVGLLHAAELVPYDSAIFISTATLSDYNDLVQDAAITLLKKRIRVYLLWYGERYLSENETQESVGGILGEVALRSGGEILHILNDNDLQEGASTHTVVAEALRGIQELDVPVDTTLSSLHIKIDKDMKKARLDTTNGVINLKKAVTFRIRNSLAFDNKENQHEVTDRINANVPLPKLHEATIFTLKTIPVDMNAEYIVFIRGERKTNYGLENIIRRLNDRKHKWANTNLARGKAHSPNTHESLRLPDDTEIILTESQYKHERVRFPDTGSEFNSDSNIDFEYKPKTEVETFSVQEIQGASNNNVKNITKSIEQKSLQNILQYSNTKIEMGWQSQLLIKPGILSKLYFEVTNMRQENVFYHIKVIDDKSFLINLTPERFFLRGGQTAAVTLTVLAPITSADRTVDHITFYAFAQNGATATLSVNLKVITSDVNEDVTAPTVSWKFGSYCNAAVNTSDTCLNHLWTLDITVQDSQSGIMYIRAKPDRGLFYMNSFTVASTDPIRLSYAATCCEPKVTLTVYDAAGNQRSYVIDANDEIPLDEASIAAITLGVLLFFLLVILLIACIVWCCRKRKRKSLNVDVSTYRSHRSRNLG